MEHDRGRVVSDSSGKTTFRRSVESFEAAIYIGGDPVRAEQLCSAWVDQNPRCVTVEPIRFVYTGGQEDGVRVKLINYPRFLATRAEIWSAAQALGFHLLEQLDQQSFSIVASDVTEWFSRRPEDLPGQS